MKKILCLLLLLLMVFASSSCKEEEIRVLRIYNWQDYIDEGDEENNSVMDDWVIWYKENYGEDVTYVYDTFETNETMLNTLKTGKTNYDLVCPSEYAIQKMIRLDMLQPFEMSIDDTGVAPYLANLFKENGWDKYAVPYMWGTVGLIYNPELVTAEEASSWNILWETKEKATAKDSIRDTYVCGVMYAYQDELNDLAAKYESGEIVADDYRKQIQIIMNRCDQETLDLVQEALVEMKNNVYGFEVDSGKNDIVTGKIAVNLAWSGDAVYSILTASEEEDVYLEYAVPTEGSNIWFDGWVMPKGADTELAESFIRFISQPEIAVRNMDYIGYSCSIAGDEIFEYLQDCYCSGEEEGTPYDLTYLFDGTLSEEYLTEGKAILYVNEDENAFQAHYPTFDIVIRCGIMEDFGDANDAVIAMWENVKMGDISIWITINLLIVIAVIIVLYGINRIIYYKKHPRKN